MKVFMFLKVFMFSKVLLFFFLVIKFGNEFDVFLIKLINLFI